MAFKDFIRKLSISRGLLPSLSHCSDTSTRLFYSCTAASILVIGVGLIGYHFYREHEELNGPTAVKNLVQINKLQADLSSLEETVSSNSDLSAQEVAQINSKLASINTEINHLSDRTGLASTSDIKKLQGNLNSSEANLNQKISALGSEIQEIKSKLNPPQSLSHDALPFTVVSIDLWNGAPFVMVAQKSDSTKVAYVGLDQSSSGWTVADISVARQDVEFTNQAGQVVKWAL